MNDLALEYVLRQFVGSLWAALFPKPAKEHAIGVYEQKRDLVEIKAVFRPAYQDIASHVLQDVLFRLEKAYKRFFQRVKHGEKPGYPRYQGRNRYTSFAYPDGAGWKLENVIRPPDTKGMVTVNLHLTKIGTVKLHLHRDLAVLRMWALTWE